MLFPSANPLKFRRRFLIPLYFQKKMSPIGRSQFESISSPQAESINTNSCVYYVCIHDNISALLSLTTTGFCRRPQFVTFPGDQRLRQFVDDPVGDRISSMGGWRMGSVWCNQRIYIGLLLFSTITWMFLSFYRFNATVGCTVLLPLTFFPEI